jgi:hypothetical protein
MKALVDHWMFEEYAPATGGLPLYRITFALLLLVFFIPAPTVFATLPASFYSPQIGPAALFSAFPPPWFCEAVNFLMVLGAVALLFGYRVRAASLGIAVLFVVLRSFNYAIGKVDGDVLVPVALFCLAWSAWGGRYSMDAVRVGVTPRRAYPAWPVCLLAMIVGLCFLTAFYSKAKSGWLDWRLETCHGQLLLNYIGAERPCRLADEMFTIHSHLFWKSLDYSTVMLEGAFILCVPRLLAMRFIMASACLFHAGIFFSMDIFFASNLIVYLCLLDERIFLRLRAGRRMLRGWMAVVRVMRPWQLVVLALLVRAIYFAVGYQWRSNGAFLSVAAVITLLIGVLCLGWGVGRVVKLFRARG